MANKHATCLVCPLSSVLNLHTSYFTVDVSLPELLQVVKRIIPLLKENWRRFPLYLGVSHEDICNWYFKSDQTEKSRFEDVMMKWLENNTADTRANLIKACRIFYAMTLARELLTQAYQ